ncbi:MULTISPECIES: hypothetical protein [unclassified Leisingera]|uniref:hypothetical protein n=1 Tax=unclassified Leisingera TaxID=2614906 RepID=UPI0010119452|nr:MULTISPECIES: hypothetical protein [unclassified Leisingera]MBQ4824233.1 hypothetical protein [Leisingera sp. HS039]MCF6429959.1 hypothetical protein [Leisingera sp. MMG026]QAX32000.1 hypothetical protein ETW24_21675 [Leisingera sp. NJS204]QBR38896.1 hypothetical protein ETW23_23835 [Leisingera sp. NJS201]
MSIERISGKEVKAMVREGARKRMSFAFCLDQGKDPLLMIQPGKKPEALKAPMKKEGGGPPMAWGTYVVRSGEMEVICESAPQRMVTELKKFLKRNPAKVNVLFYDDGGNLLDSLKPEAPEGQVTEEDAADISASGIDASAIAPLKRRLKRIQPRISLAPGPLELKLKRALAKSVSLINDGRLQEAETMVVVIERAVARIGQDREDEAKSMKRGQREMDQRSLGAQVKRAQSLQANVARAPGKVRDRLGRALHVAARHLKRRDLDSARDAMDKIEKALTALV